MEKMKKSNRIFCCIVLVAAVFCFSLFCPSVLAEELTETKSVTEAVTETETETETVTEPETTEPETTEPETTEPPASYTYEIKLGEGFGYPEKLIKTENKPLTLPGATPCRYGFRFAGFVLSETDTVPAYFPGDVLTLERDTVFYALWKKQAAVPGDVDYDGTVSCADARLALRISVGLEKGGTAVLAAADVDKSGKLDSEDARRILRSAMGLANEKSVYEIYPDENFSTDSASVKGVTSKGYTVYEKDGKTYIDGVLIVNKTYALPQSYAPGALTRQCTAAFNDMKAAAQKEGLSIYVGSGYRSYSQQSSIYSRYCSKDGQRLADTYSARPGHSEHQTGLAIDLNTISSSFANTKEGKWVEQNCWKYGFILRYPSNGQTSTGYQYEPWHIRYVGRRVAEKIHNSGKCLEDFYGITSAY